MSRYIDADALIADMQERYCKPCKERKEDYNEVRCRACWVDDAMDEVDGFGDKGIDIVRCKECKWYGTDDCPMCNECQRKPFPTEPDDYCSYGVKKGADDE